MRFCDEIVSRCDFSSNKKLLRPIFKQPRDASLLPGHKTIHFQKNDVIPSQDRYVIVVSIISHRTVRRFFPRLA
jgi:hypothetical protein